MQNLQSELIEVLKDQDLFLVDDKLNKNKIVESCLRLDPLLISLLINNETFKKYFFVEIENTLVFDKIKFQRFVNNKSFLPDSYTAFKNKIGLIIDDESIDNFIKSKNDIVLSWPHKDCVLEGGQTKEDQKRDEIFWNETLSPESIDRVLDPKVFTNFIKYNKDGSEKISDLNANENYIIKGNNLLVISSLLKTHRGKIKLIYIDPPYNTGGDANIFTYNNTFNHSTWLTFMKNRLEISKKLLTKDGFIAIAIDHYELAYLTVLADEIFERENRLGIITVVHNAQGRNQEKFFGTSNEFMLVYAKNKNFAEFNKVALDKEKKLEFNLSDNKGNYKESSFIRIEDGKEKTEKRMKNFYYPIYVSENLNNVSIEFNESYIPVYPINNGIKKTWKTKKESFLEKFLNNEIILKRIDGVILIYQKLYENQVIKTHWVHERYSSRFHGTKRVEKILGRKGMSYPKSIYTVLDTLKLMTSKNDIVLDFHAGSGTTAHAVLDLNKEDGGDRKFILVEQLDEHINDCVELVQKVVNQDSFVYMELAKYNEKYIQMITRSQSKKELISIWKEMSYKAILSYQFDKNIFDERQEAFKTASLEIMQKYLIEILDKNQLYINLTEIEDNKFNLSDEIKRLNYLFYKSDK